MSFNSSNASLLPPHLSSSNSSLDLGCFNHSFSFLIYFTFSITNVVLLLPLCVLVLYLGLQRWRRQRPTAESHSDVFTYHMVAMEMIGIFGCGLYFCSTCVDVPWLMMTGLYFFSFTINGQVLLHILTCVERHLAVVHPITYLRLKKRGGVRIRNVTIGGVWLTSLGWCGVVILENSIIPLFCASLVSIVVVSFCSFSVLCALIHPGPGEGGGDKEKVDHFKMRAFHTIVAITGALLFRFGGHLLVVSVSWAMSERVGCGLLLSGVWFCLPSSLVLPLLFLHRAGKLRWCRNNNDSRPEQSRAEHPKSDPTQ